MEDAIVIEQLADNVHLFAVCDGHGGPEVAHLVAQKLAATLRAEPSFKSGNYASALSEAFRKLDELISSPKGEEQLRALNKTLKGRELGREDKVGYRAGTTCLALLLTKDKYYVGNIGDSRAVLCREGKSVALSSDHKPDLPAEKERIEKAGGYVHNGRVNNSLALSRSLGDFEFKHFSSRPYE
jgi:serine/threonine protein phosphatase PrpC